MLYLIKIQDIIHSRILYINIISSIGFIITTSRHTSNRITACVLVLLLLITRFHFVRP